VESLLNHVDSSAREEEAREEEAREEVAHDEERPRWPGPQESDRSVKGKVKEVAGAVVGNHSRRTVGAGEQQALRS
jgi:hypothetical protein